MIELQLHINRLFECINSMIEREFDLLGREQRALDHYAKKNHADINIINATQGRLNQRFDNLQNLQISIAKLKQATDQQWETAKDYGMEYERQFTQFSNIVLSWHHNGNKITDDKGRLKADNIQMKYLAFNAFPLVYNTLYAHLPGHPQLPEPKILTKPHDKYN